MKSTVLSITIHAVCTLVSFHSYGQSSLSVSFPMIWSDVKVKDNWTPSTAPNYKEYREGSAFGYGVSLNYSFHPKFLIKDKHFSVNVGAGYFNQGFDIKRPFDYNSFIYIIYYTNHYAYQCLSLSVGLQYKYPLGKKHFLTANLYYYWLNSFRQDYTPTYSSPNRGFGGFTQFNNNQIDYGRMLSVSVGLKKQLGDRFSAGISLLVPIYTRWRNDQIFKDDPLTFSRPDFSLGSEISVAYHFKKQQP